MMWYHAVVTRDDKWWMISVPEIDALTQALAPSEIDINAHELISVTTDRPMDSFAIDYAFPGRG